MARYIEGGAPAQVNNNPTVLDNIDLSQYSPALQGSLRQILEERPNLLLAGPFASLLQQNPAVQAFLNQGQSQAPQTNNRNIENPAQRINSQGAGVNAAPVLQSALPGATQAAATQQAAQNSRMLGSALPQTTTNTPLGNAIPSNTAMQQHTGALGAAMPASVGASDAIPEGDGGDTFSGGDMPSYGSGYGSSGGSNWGGIASGIGGLAAGLFGLGGDDSDMSDAINQSSAVYQKYLQEALAEMQKEQGQGRTDLTGYMTPYTQAGQVGLDEYMQSLGLAGGKGRQSAIDRFQASPGYQYALNQGLQATQRGEAARGLGGSGAEMAALQNRGQQMANQEYGKWQDQLANLASGGRQAAEFTGGGLSSQDLGYGSDIAQLYGTMGQAQAEAQMAAAKAQEQQEQSESSGLGDIIGGAASLIGML